MNKTYYSGKTPKHLEMINPKSQSFRLRFGFNEVENEPSFCNEVEYDRQPTLEEIKKVILNYYNDKCNQEILSGLTYEGSLVWLSSENQFNYKAAFDFAFQTVASGGEFIPVTVKLGEEDTPVYKTFSDITELQEFITSCLTHTQNTLSKYWEIKDNIDWSKYEI